MCKGDVNDAPRVLGGKVMYTPLEPMNPHKKRKIAIILRLFFMR